MVDRLFIGQVNNRMTLRMTAPGYSATHEGSPFILSSDHDYLKIHQRGDFRLSSYKSGNNFTQYIGYVEFPELPFVPHVFHSPRVFSSVSSGYMVFPFDTPQYTTWYPTSDSMLVSNKAIWWSFTGVNIEQRIDMRYIIFKNKMADYG